MAAVPSLSPRVRLTTFRIPSTVTAGPGEKRGIKSSAAIIRFSKRCTNGSPLDYFRQDGKEASTWNEAPREARSAHEWYTEHTAYGTVGFMLWSAALAVASRTEGGSDHLSAHPWWRDETVSPRSSDEDTKELLAFSKHLYPNLERNSYYDGETACEHFLTLAWRRVMPPPSPRIDRELVGYISCSYSRPRDVISIDVIATKGSSGLPEYKSMKIGTKLLRASFARAKREEPLVNWAMVSPHPNAISFYAKAGKFRSIGCGENAKLAMIRVLRKGGRGAASALLPPIERVIEIFGGGEEDEEYWTPETFRGEGCSMSWPEEDIIAQFFDKRRKRGGRQKQQRQQR